MRIAKITAQYRNDFYADMVCEHCGSEAKLTTGYNDANYHVNVIPAIHCTACGKNRAGDKLLKKDEDGFTVVTVADLKAYLSKYPDDTPVSLDTDGWCCTAIPHSTVAELIAQRNLFFEFKRDGQLRLFINN